MNEVDNYITSFPVDVQNRLAAIRAIIHEEVPQVTERICMNMPTFELNGKWFVHFAAFSKHIGFYPQPEGVAAFSDRLIDYKTSKGAIQFPLSKPLPLDLVREIVRYRAKMDETNSKKPSNKRIIEQSVIEKPKVFSMSFAKVYPLLVSKVKKKGGLKSDVDSIIYWLTGYDQLSMEKQIACGVDIKTFFDEAPQINPNAASIKGVVCGVRVEEIKDETMQKIRFLDKMIDELAKGKSLNKILRK
ncbi:DUF2200 family protein [Acholeplasma sp. OttesenSCG-928-E16]|nr:DUF2200 family protein [Acholeplasma sp. OttesenSCG-928-E16]